MSNGPKRSFITGIDLTSRAQAERADDRVKATFTEPEMSLAEASIDSLPDMVRDAVKSAGWTSLMPVQK